MLGFGAVIPMLPVYLHEQAGASTFVTGLMIGMSSAFALLGRLFAGKVADRHGRRIALLLGMAFCAAAGVLYLPLFGLYALAAGRLFHGLGEGFFVTAAVAWAVDVAPDNRRAQALGYLSSGIWGGVSLGPVIGQALGTMASVAWFLTLSSVVVMAIVFADGGAAAPARAWSVTLVSTARAASRDHAGVGQRDLCGDGGIPHPTAPSAWTMLPPGRSRHSR